MESFKPSELPVGTTIEVGGLEYYGTYHKVDNSVYGIWWESDDFEDCQGTYGASDEQADERFKDFKIVSLPFTVVEYLQREISKIVETDCHDFDIRKALKHHLESEDICPHPNGGVPPEGCC